MMPDQLPFTDHLTQHMYHEQRRDSYLTSPRFNEMPIHWRKEMADYHNKRMDYLVHLFRRIIMNDPERVTRDWMVGCFP